MLIPSKILIRMKTKCQVCLYISFYNNRGVMTLKDYFQHSACELTLTKRSIYRMIYSKKYDSSLPITRFSTVRS